MLRSKRDVDKYAHEILGKIKSEREKNLRCLSIAQQYYKACDYESAKRYAEKYLSVKDDSPPAYKLLGQCYEHYGNKTKALENYKLSLNLNLKQPDLILKVCELMSNYDIKIDKDLARYWCGKGETCFPHHPVIFNLKQRLINSSDSRDTESIENIISKEVHDNPNNIALWVQLLTLQMETGKVKSAYEKAFSKTIDKVYFDNIQCCECYYNICKLYKEQFNDLIDDEFYTYYLFVTERLLANSVQDVKTTLADKSISQCLSCLRNFDGILLEASSYRKKIRYPGFFQKIIHHMSVQLAAHITNIFLKKAKLVDHDWEEFIKYVSPLLLFSVSIIFDSTNCGDLFHSNQNLCSIHNICKNIAEYRVIQSGYTLLMISKNSEKLFIEKTLHFLSSKWREVLIQKLCTNASECSDFLEGSYFVKCMEFLGIPTEIPASLPKDIKRHVEVTQLIYPDSLHHLVWLGVHYLMWESKSILDSCLPPGFATSCFETIQFQTKRRSIPSAESLCILDIDAFLYATVFCTKSMIEVEMRHGFFGKEKPYLLPSDISHILCSSEQNKWWMFAHQMANRTISENDIVLSRLTLQHGIEVIRLLIKCRICPQILVQLARTFMNRARHENQNPERSEALECRGLLYWNAAVVALEKLEEKSSPVVFSKQLFDYVGNELKPPEIVQLLNEGRMVIATKLMNDKQFESAIEILKNLHNPHSYFNQALIYIMMANSELGKNVHDLNSVVHSTATALLNKAQMYLNLCKDAMQSDVNHPLHHQVNSKIEDVEQLLKYLEVSERSGTSLFNYTSGHISHDDVTPFADTSIHRVESDVDILSTPRGRSPKSSLMNTSYTIKCLKSPFSDQKQTPTITDQITKMFEKLETKMLEKFELLMVKENSLTTQVANLQDMIMSITKQMQDLLVDVEKLKVVNSLSIPDDEEQDYFDQLEVAETPLPQPYNILLKNPPTFFPPGAYYPPVYDPTLNSVYPNLVNPVATITEITSDNKLSYFSNCARIYTSNPSQDQGTQASPTAPSKFTTPQQSMSPNVNFNKSTERQQINMPSNVTINKFMEPDQNKRVPKVAIAEPKFVVGGLTFDSKPILNHVKEEKPAADVDPKPKQNPFASFNFGVSMASTITTPSKSLFASIVSTSSNTNTTPITTTAASTGLFGFTTSSIGVNQTDTSTFGNKGLFSAPSIDFSTIAKQTHTTTFSPNKDLQGFKGAGSLVFGTPKSPGSPDISTAHTDEFVPTAEFTPVIPLPELVEVKTGEEGLEVLYEERCKLLRYINKEWKERGIGKMKILHDKINSHVRLLMRREQVHKVCCNQLLTKAHELKQMSSTDKAWSWYGKDYSEGEIHDELFAIRFKTAEQAQAFKSAFDNAKSLIKEEPHKTAEEQPSNTTDEFVPTAEFTPVIPLPELVEVKTGEEGLEVLYEERCKLLRYINKEWKERGIGKMKILHDKINSHVRLLMRREHVHKVCCNQLLTKAHELKPMSSTDKAWSWYGKDYSEGEIHDELFAIRFKTAEQAQAFKSAFDNAKSLIKEESHKTAEDQPSNTQLPKLSELFKKESGSWECSDCYTRNNGSQDTCVACTASKKSATVDNSSISEILNPNDTWECGECSIQNLESLMECSACGFLKDVEVSELFVFGSSMRRAFSFGTPEIVKSADTPGEAEKSESEDDEENEDNIHFENELSDGLNEKILEVSDDVIFVRADEVTEEEKKLAISLHLPEMFFAYKYKNPCPGCVGCDNDDEENGTILKSDKSCNKNQTASSTATVITQTTPSKKETNLNESKPVFGTPPSISNNQSSSIFSGKPSPLTFGSNSPQISNTPVIHTSDEPQLRDSKPNSSVVSTPTFSFASFGSSKKSIFDTSAPIASATTDKISPANESSTSGTQNKDGISSAMSSFSFAASPANDSSTSSSQNKDNISSAMSSFSFATPTKPFSFEALSKSSVPDPSPGSFSMFNTNPTSISTTSSTSLQNTLFSFEGSKMSTFESRSSATSIFGASKTIFAGLAQESNTKKDTTSEETGSNKQDVKLPNFGFKDTGLSFSALAESSEATFKKAPDGFSWPGAGTSIFNVTPSDKKDDSLAKDENEDDEEENCEDTSATSHDPYFEPIIALPDMIQVRTGEEDEEIKFCARGKVFRYNNDTKEWKERGVGDVKILYNAANKTYRLLMRREQVHKVVLNQRLLSSFEIKPMSTNPNSWCWVALNMPEECSEPSLESLAVRFKNEDISSRFHMTVSQCISHLNEIQKSVAVEDNKTYDTKNGSDSDKSGYGDYDTLADLEENSEGKFYVDEEAIKDAMERYTVEEDESGVLFSSEAVLTVVIDDECSVDNGVVNVVNSKVERGKIEFIGLDGEILSIALITPSCNMQKINHSCAWAPEYDHILPDGKKDVIYEFSDDETAAEFIANFEKLRNFGPEDTPGADT